MAEVAELYNNIKSWLGSKWRASYLGMGATARNVAKNMLLIHVTGKASGAPFEELIINPPRVLKTSACSWCEANNRPNTTSNCLRCKSDKTRADEDMLGLGRNVYFYSGRAHSKFGSVALAFGPRSEAQHTGSGNFFDTGGLARGILKTSLTVADDAELKAFVKQHGVALNRWRTGLGRHLTENFSKPSDYFDGRPCQPGPADLFDKNIDWRAWAFEVRFHEPQDIHEAVAWCAPPGQIQSLTEALSQVDSFDETLFERLQVFMDNNIYPEGADESCERIELWARLELEKWLCPALEHGTDSLQ